MSDTDGKPTTAIPLTIVILVSAIKDWIEDRQRVHSDSLQNNRKVQRADPFNTVFNQETWSNLKVGQIVRVLRDQEIPADLILLSASHRECYVETSMLDGETNLKQKSTLDFF